MADIESILDKVDQIKNEESDTATPRSRSGIAAIIVGGIVGIMVGASKKWNLFYSAIGGAVAGGVVGTLLVPKTDK